MTLKELQEQKMKEFDDMIIKTLKNTDSEVSDIPYGLIGNYKLFVQLAQEQAYNMALDTCIDKAIQGVEYYGLVERPTEEKTLRDYVELITNLKTK